jgi:cytoskeletal protein CcmA (bactofilin family)
MLRKNHNDKGSKEVKKDFGPAVQPASAPGQKTVIGEHISIKGDIKGKEDLVIQGKVQGGIELPDCHLTIGTKGQVEAEIQAANVTISGHLVGNIQASGKVQITKEADFRGAISSKSISVEDGAFLQASIELIKEGDAKIKRPTPIIAPGSETLELGKAEKAGA